MSAPDPEPAMLAAAVAAAFPGAAVAVGGVRRLSAGASRLTLAVEATVDGQPLEVVAQIDRQVPPVATPAEGDAGRSTAVQAALLRRLASGPVPVPTLLLADDGALLGAPLLLTEAVEGETLPPRILRDPALAAAREGFAADCGAILASLHAADGTGLGLQRCDALDDVRSALDAADEPRPVFELAYAHLAAHRPPAGPDAIVHGDFRLGNLIVDPGGVRAVLDWELAHIGDPMEDIGWLCSAPWRFGRKPPVGGMGERHALYEAYGAAGGRRVDPEVAAWWEMLATLRWGAICMRQARRHLEGSTRSVELAAVGRRVCETEWDLAGLLGLVAPGERPPSPAPAPPAPPGQHGRPTAAELLEAAGEHLTALVERVSPEERFHLRVAANVLAVVAREVALGPAQARAHRARLEALGFADSAELARAVRSGGIRPAEQAAAHAAMVADVADRLAVANPRYGRG